MPGPIPKRSDQRRRVNVIEGLTKAVSTSPVRIPRSRSHWDPIAKRWFNSLKASGQSQFYEQSDWAQAEYVAELMSRTLTAATTPPTLVSAVLSAAKDLMTTEGARRTVRLELQRAPTGPDLQAESKADIRDILRAVPSS